MRKESWGLRYSSEYGREDCIRNVTSISVELTLQLQSQESTFSKHGTTRDVCDVVIKRKEVVFY